MFQIVSNFIIEFLHRCYSSNFCSEFKELHFGCSKKPAVSWKHTAQLTDMKCVPASSQHPSKQQRCLLRQCQSPHHDSSIVTCLALQKHSSRFPQLCCPLYLHLCFHLRKGIHSSWFGYPVPVSPLPFINKLCEPLLVRVHIISSMKTDAKQNWMCSSELPVSGLCSHIILNYSLYALECLEHSTANTSYGTINGFTHFSTLTLTFEFSFATNFLMQPRTSTLNTKLWTQYAFDFDFPSASGTML